MSTPYSCPLCSDPYDAETNLRVHLEVEHRKSELARYVVEHGDEQTDRVAERDVHLPTA